MGAEGELVVIDKMRTNFIRGSHISNTIMPTPTRIPPLLQPYLQLPRRDALLLVTSNLGATANWLLVRYISDALSDGLDAAHDEGYNVVLVSWMREYEFWRQEARKGAGLDLERLKKQGKFAFVDGLTKVSLQATALLTSPANTAQSAPRVIPAAAPSSRRLPARGPPPAQAPAISSNTVAPLAQTSNANAGTPGPYTLTSLDLEHVRDTVTQAVIALSSSSGANKTLLILDNPDLLLALSLTTTPSALTSLLLNLHTLPTVSHILAHVQSDTSLVSLSAPPQALEVSQHNFLVKVAHMARRIVGVRVLDTGVARDVSGVLRITEQTDDWVGCGFEEDEDHEKWSGKGKEFLYRIMGDGSVKVFERGAGGEG